MSSFKDYTGHILFLLFLCACSTPTSLIGPDGTPHFIVKCGHIEQCYREARKLCEGNYEIVNTTTSTDVFNRQSTISQDLLIKCENTNLGQQVHEK